MQRQPNEHVSVSLSRENREYTTVCRRRLLISLATVHLFSNGNTDRIEAHPKHTLDVFMTTAMLIGRICSGWQYTRRRAVYARSPCLLAQTRPSSLTTCLCRRLLYLTRMYARR